MAKPTRKQIADYGSKLRADLGAIEADLEDILGEMYQINYDLTTALKDTPEDWMRRDINAAYNLAARSAGVLGLGMPSGASIVPISAAYLAAATKATQDSIRIAKEAEAAVTVYRTADVMSRLGTFYSTKLGIALLSRAGVSVTVYFDTPSMIYAENALESLANEDFLTGILGEAAVSTESQLGDMLLRVIDIGMATIPVPAIPMGTGSGYTAILNNTGALARSLGLLSSSGAGGASPMRRYKRGRRAQREAHSITVGITKTSGREMIYGETLAMAIPSKPPGLSARRWGKSVWDRIYAWADQRGHGRKTARYIGGKILKRGTYGRRWMAAIIEKMDIAIPRVLTQEFANRVQKFLMGEE